MELLQGKTAIAPGGTRGIGLAVVRVFLQNGARVALFGSRQETADRAVAALKSEEPGWDVIGLAPDLTDFASVQAAVEAVRARFGGVDILVNNAGISAREPLADYTPEAFRKIMDLNVTAVFNGCKAVEPIMRAAGHGADAARKEEGRMILLQLFWSFLQIGLFSFGGGYAAMPLLQEQLVARNGWLSVQEFADLVTIAEMTPGPIAVNAATFVGTKLAGLPGALLLVNAFWDGGPVTLAETNWTMLLLFAGCLLLLRKTKLSPILIMVLAGVINVVKAVLAG